MKKLFNELIYKLEHNIPYRFSRWGDGEWSCMMGESGANRDGNMYIPELGKRLRGILDSKPSYYMGLQYGVIYNKVLRDFVFTYLFNYDINWTNGDVLHQASEYGYLQKFIDALSYRNTIIVGAEYFTNTPYCHITTPGTDAYFENETICKAMNEIWVTVKDPVFLIASAMNSNILIDELPDYVTAINIGSVLDPYLGRARATYQYNMKPKKLW